MLKSIVKKTLAKRIHLQQLMNWKKEVNLGINYHHIYIACLPKSGSTFIANAIKNITGYPIVQFQPIRGDNDHNVDPITFLDSIHKNTITQLHTKANQHNLSYLKSYNFKIIFLTRNLLDSLNSFRNHMVNENDKWFMYATPINFSTWTKVKQFDFIIDYVLPWYISFIVSWQRAIRNNDLQILHIRYEDFISDNHLTLSNIFQFYNLGITEEQISTGLKNTYLHKFSYRYNKKTTKEIYNFSDLQIQKVIKMCEYYPDTEFEISYH